LQNNQRNNIESVSWIQSTVFIFHKKWCYWFQSLKRTLFELY